MATEQPITKSELHEMLTQEREANRDTFRFELRDTLQEREANRETFRSELRDTLQHYATKADLAEVRGEIKAMRWTMALVGLGLSILMIAIGLVQ